MGVSTSLHMLYADAISWFTTFIDKDIYTNAFEELTVLGGGGGSVTFVAIQNWINEKAKAEPESCWSLFQSSGMCLMMSHKAAAMHMDSSSTVVSRKVVDITEFRAFLIHLYATSLLWRHFVSCNPFTMEYHADELYKKKLTKQEFSVACKSFASAHGKEQLSKEIINRDFAAVDLNCTGAVGFVQVGTIVFNFAVVFLVYIIYINNIDMYTLCAIYQR